VQPRIPADPDATHVGVHADPDATRVGTPVDDDATWVGTPADDDATWVGAPVEQNVTSGGAHVYRDPSAEAEESDDDTFVAIREPVLPWNTPSYPMPSTPASSSPETGRNPWLRRPRLWWLIAAVAVVVIAAVIITLSLVSHKKTSDAGAARKVVEHYLEDLVGGDANAALKIWHPDTASGEDLLLDQKIYAAAKNRPTRYEIKSTSHDGDRATVEAALTQSGKSFELTFELERGSGSSWTVTSGPDQQVVLNQPAPKVTVNGVAVSLPASKDKVSLSALPGDYAVVAASAVKGVNYVDDTVTVLPTTGDDGRTSLSFPSSEVRAAVDQGASPLAGGKRPGDAEELSASGHAAVTLLSPASNIGCDLSGNHKGCGVLSYRDDVNQTDGNKGTWWFDLKGGAAPSLTTRNSLAQFQAKHAKPHQMDYGESVYYQDDVCVMLQTGMTCWDTRTGHGMFMARKGYSTF
jgi:hypothetical protein